ncbi:glycosyltransferase family 4 protein [Paenibacillus contaminans]|uniref:Glycosyltransferase family 1 protein n=1 Tax=Paenibacillus contaminans TaxID=450362 RepID=A0A329MQ20_9BACL|nr:glycosyltransferase family 4 protein [Paenibacillus contaminans]RAV22071.1 glycosyltransferase family 1 protein [Paenibacillus contaminans]
MRVLFVYIIPGGGVDTLNRQRCHALSQEGIECHCLYFQPGSGLQNVEAEGVPTFVTGNPSEMIAIINHYQYEALVVTCAFMEVRMLRQLGYGGRIVYEIQGLGTMAEARQKMADSHQYIAAYADAILVPATPHVLDLCAETFPNKLTYSFNNPLDTKTFTYRKVPKPDAPIAAWFGRLEYNKNWRDFLFIGYHLVQQKPETQLWMFHDHTLAQADDAALFELTVADLKLQGNLVIRSNVPHAEMPAIFSTIGDSGGFLCAPSRVEGAPYAVIEAMSCRCPVLTTDSDGVRSAVVHNVTGKYFDHGDIDGAVREALELMNDKTLRERIRRMGQKHIEDSFSIELYCRYFVEMLREVGAL